MKESEKMKNKIEKIKSNSFWNNLFKNSFWAFVGEASASLLGLIITIFLIKIIGSDNYGIIVLAQSYMSIMDVLINIQSWKSVIQFGQHCIVNKKYDKLNSYVKLGAFLDISTAIICTIISFFVSRVIGYFFDWPNELIICSQIFSITIISHFAGTPTAVLRIFNKFHLVAVQKFIGALIKLITFLVLYIKFKTINLYSATIIYCITDIINNLLLVVFSTIIYNKKCGLKNLIVAKMPKDKKEFINYTIWGTLADIVDIPVNYFDVFLISLLGNTYVSVFKVFKQCVSIFQKLSSPIQQSIMPQFSELAAKNEQKRGFEVVKKIQKTMFKIMVPFAIIVGCTSKIWLKLVYGVIYSQKWYVLLLYLIVQAYAVSYSTIHPYFLSLNQPKKSTIYVTIANIAYMILSLSLIKPLGMIGIIFSFFIQCIIVINLKKRYIDKLNI